MLTRVAFLLVLWPSLALGQAVYLVHPTLDECLARSAEQCTALGCDGVLTKYWWGCEELVTPTKSGGVKGTGGEAALVVVPGTPYGAVTTNDHGTAGLTAEEVRALQTEEELGAALGETLMADTITANYHWVKPEISGSPTTWGVKLNADLDLIDAQLAATQSQALQGDTSVGDIKMFAGATPPTDWRLCDGAVYNNVDIPLLAPILNNQYNAGTSAVAGISSAVPDLRQIFPIGAGTVGSVALALGQTGGEKTHVLTTAETPSHAHTVTDPGHIHSILDPTHDHQWVAQDYSVQGAAPGTGDDLSIASGSGSSVGGTENKATGITINSAPTGVTVGNTGGGGAHNNMPPYLGINFIIKFR